LIVLATHLRPCRRGCRLAIGLIAVATTVAAATAVIVAAMPPLPPDSSPDATLSVPVAFCRRR